MQELYHTNYYIAAHWLNNALVLCNNIAEIDDSVWDNFEPIVNLGYEPEYDDEDEVIVSVCPECGAPLEQVGPNIQCSNCDYCEEENEIFQWFITNCSQSDVEYLTKTFGLLFTYSNMLDCYILCVTHFGTMWSGVDWETTNKHAERQCGETK